MSAEANGTVQYVTVDWKRERNDADLVVVTMETRSAHFELLSLEVSKEKH